MGPTLSLSMNSREGVKWTGVSAQSRHPFPKAHSGTWEVGGSPGAGPNDPTMPGWRRKALSTDMPSSPAAPGCPCSTLRVTNMSST